MVIVVTKRGGGEGEEIIASVLVTTFFGHLRQGRLQKLNNAV